MFLESKKHLILQHWRISSALLFQEHALGWVLVSSTALEQSQLSHSALAILWAMKCALALSLNSRRAAGHGGQTMQWKFSPHWFPCPPQLTTTLTKSSPYRADDRTSSTASILQAHSRAPSIYRLTIFLKMKISPTINWADVAVAAVLAENSPASSSRRSLVSGTTPSKFTESLATSGIKSRLGLCIYNDPALILHNPIRDSTQTTADGSHQLCGGQQLLLVISTITQSVVGV